MDFLLYLLFNGSLLYIIVGIIALLWLKSSIVIVRQKQVALVERLGKYAGSLEPGIGFKLPAPISVVVKHVSTQQQQIQHNVEVKTKDNAFVTFPVSIQYVVTDAAKAYYELSKPTEQIASYVLNTVRSMVAKMALEELYTAQNEIAQKVQETLQENMGNFGYKIVTVLVDQPMPRSRTPRTA